MRVKKEFFKVIFGNTLKGTNGFRALYTDKGHGRAVFWFEEFTKGNMGKYEKRLTENQFILFLRQLTSFSDHEILSILDIFDNELSSSVGLDEFLLLLSLLSAREYGCLTEFLFYHQTAMFQILYGTHTVDRKPTLNFTQFAQLGFVLGVQTSYVQEFLAKLFNIDIITAEFGLDSFVLYYFGIFQLMDKYATQTHNSLKAKSEGNLQTNLKKFGRSSLRGGAPTIKDDDGVVEIKREKKGERELKPFASVFFNKIKDGGAAGAGGAGGVEREGSTSSSSSVGTKLMSPGRMSSSGGTPRSARINSGPAAMSERDKAKGSPTARASPRAPTKLSQSLSATSPPNNNLTG